MSCQEVMITGLNYSFTCAWFQIPTYFSRHIYFISNMSPKSYREMNSRELREVLENSVGEGGGGDRLHCMYVMPKIFGMGFQIAVVLAHDRGLWHKAA